MCTDILRMDVELKNLDDGKLGILLPADPDTTMLSDLMSKSPRNSPMSLDDGKIEILPPTAEPDVTMLSDPVLKSSRDSPLSLDDGKIEILPPADLDVTMSLDPPSVSPRESQFQEPITNEPLLSTPKLDIENLFIDSPHHSGVDEVKSVLWEKEIEKFGGKLKSVPGEECFLGLFGVTEEQVSNVVKESEERLDQVVVEEISCIYRPSRKRKKNNSKESDMKGRKKQRAGKSGSCKDNNEKKGHQVK